MEKRVVLGRITEIWRYPVKSMLGERLQQTAVNADGIEGDRRFALRVLSDGSLVSAKRVPEMFDFHARISRSRMLGIEFPDGSLHAGDAPGLDALLSRALGRQVTLAEVGDSFVERIGMGASADSTEGEGHFETTHGFHDSADVHLLTTAQLEVARALYPAGDWDRRRFRPNLFIESDVTGADLAPGIVIGVGQDLRLEVVKGCSRCVMTTHPQEDLEKDPQILRTLARGLGNILGTLTSVVETGTITVGDEVWRAG
jgi:uncharacterized protein YcbX